MIPLALQEDRLRRLFYRRHPARLHPHGIVDQLQALAAAEVAQYYQNRYTAANMTLTVVGNVTMAQLLQHASTEFAIARRGVRRPFQILKNRSSWKLASSKLLLPLLSAVKSWLGEPAR